MSCARVASALQTLLEQSGKLAETVEARGRKGLHEPPKKSRGVPCWTMDTESIRKVLSTESVPEGQRTEYWLDMICTTYVHLDCVVPDDQRLFGDIAFNRLGSLDFTHLRANAKRVRRTPDRIRKGGEDYFLVQVQREGKCVACQDGRMALLSPGDFVLYDST